MKNYKIKDLKACEKRIENTIIFPIMNVAFGGKMPYISISFLYDRFLTVIFYDYYISKKLY